MASQPGDGRDEAQYRYVAVVSVSGLLMKSVSRTNVGVKVYPFKIFLSLQRRSCAPQSGGFHYTCTLL